MHALKEIGAAFQLGIVVEDIQSSMKHWVSTYGVGPFLYVKDAGSPACVFRGQPGEVRIGFALSFLGDTEIELIQPLDSSPSPYTEFIQMGRAGIQHIGVMVPDFSVACARLEENGLTTALSLKSPGGPDEIRYYEDATMRSTMFEIMEGNRNRRQFHETVKTMTKAWDRGDPIREYTSIADFLSRHSVDQE